MDMLAILDSAGALELRVASGLKQAGLKRAFRAVLGESTVIHYRDGEGRRVKMGSSRRVCVGEMFPGEAFRIWVSTPEP